MKKTLAAFCLTGVLSFASLADAQTVVTPQYSKEALASAPVVVTPKYNPEELVNPVTYYPYMVKNLSNSPVVVYVSWTKKFTLKYELDRNQQVPDVLLPLGVKVKVTAYAQVGNQKGTHQEEIAVYYFVNYNPKFERGWLVGYKP